MSKPSVGIYLDKRHKKQSNLYPVKIRVTHNRVNRFYSSGVDLTEKQFETVKRGDRLGDLWKTKEDLDSQIKDVKDILDSMRGQFTFKSFKNKYKGEPTEKPEDVFEALKQYQEYLERHDRIGSAESYRSARKSLRRFHGKEELPFDVVTVEFLEKYEKWMKKYGHYRVFKNGKTIEKPASDTTIGIYLRGLRRVFNVAIEDGIISEDMKPFGDSRRGRYSIPESENNPKALPFDAIQRILQYNPTKGSSEEYYRDLWVFSYLGAGINMADISYLRYSNMYEESIFYFRAKTIRSRKKKKAIELSLIDESKAIIERWGNIPKEPDQYIFPILKQGLSPTEEKQKIRQVTKMTNVYMRKIAKNLGIENDITTYTARHSYATVLKDLGEPTQFIKEALGHSSVSVTENYLKSLGSKKKTEITKKLISNGQ